LSAPSIPEKHGLQVEYQKAANGERKNSFSLSFNRSKNTGGF